MLHSNGRRCLDASVFAQVALATQTRPDTAHWGHMPNRAVALTDSRIASACSCIPGSGVKTCRDAGRRMMTHDAGREDVLRLRPPKGGKVLRMQGKLTVSATTRPDPQTSPPRSPALSADRRAAAPDVAPALRPGAAAADPKDQELLPRGMLSPADAAIFAAEAERAADA